MAEKMSDFGVNHLDSGTANNKGESFHIFSSEDEAPNANFVSLSLLKKDDSGIEIEKSPTNTSKDGLSDQECSESTSETGGENMTVTFLESDSGNQVDESQSDSDITAPAVSSGIATINCLENMDESYDMEHGEDVHLAQPDSSQVDMDTKASGHTGTIDANADESHGLSSQGDVDVDMAVGASSESSSSSESRKRRLERHSLSSSDSDSTDSDEEKHHRNDDDNKADSSDAAEDNCDCDENDFIGPNAPKQKWRALQDLHNREVGYTNKTPPGLWREKVQGSVQMARRLKLQYRMEGHEGCVNALHFNRIGTLLASGSDDLNIVLWNWTQNKPSLVYHSGHTSNVFQAKFMPFSGDCHVVSCARDGQVRLAELSLTGVCKQTKKLAQHRGAAHKLALELDSPHVFLSCGEDAVTFEVDLRVPKANKLAVTKENDKKVALYSIHSNPVQSNEFCVGGRDHYIRIYDKRMIQETVNSGVVKKYCPHHLMNSETKANITCCCYNYSGSEVLGTYNDEDIYLFSNRDSDGAEFIHRYEGHRNNATVKGINFYGPKSEFVVSGSDCGNVYLWDKETEKVVQFVQADDGGVINVLEPHPFAPYLATSGLDHDVKIWAPTAEEPSKLPGLKRTMKRNKRERERERERTAEPDTIDGQMLWFIMRHFRRSARHRLRQEGEDISSSSDNDSAEDSDESEDGQERLQCAPS